MIWGIAVVPLSYGALAFAAVLMSARLLPTAPRIERWAAAALLGPALGIAVISLLSVAHAIAPLGWLLGTLACGVAAWPLAGAEARALAGADVGAMRAAAADLRREPLALYGITLGVVAVGLGILAAALLEPFGWDALGYHLPIVHDALEVGTIRDVPGHDSYINTYPRLVDVSFIGWRLAIGSEHLVELGQLPFVPAVVLPIAALAVRGGVPTPRAIGAACLFLTVPVTMLQLASSYVDVAIAAMALITFLFVTATPDRGTLTMAAIASGLLLGSKPSAPPVVAVALVTLLVVTYRAGQLRGGILACVGSMVIGAPKYVENIVEYGNPIWPVELRLGPVVFDGLVPMAELTTIGLREPYLSMRWPERVLASWFAVPPFYIYDMRIGGLGPFFSYVLLPLAVVAALVLWRSRERRALPAVIPIALVSFATLATPGGFWARYTLAMPAALIALALVLGERVAPRWRAGIDVLLALGATAGLVIASWGFSGGGPHVLALTTMPRDVRIREAAVDSQEREWDAAREAVAPGEAFGYDRSFGMAGRLVRRDGLSRVVYFGDAARDVNELITWADAERVRVVVLRDPGNSDLARAHPERFRERFRSAYPDWQPCAVFDVLPR